MALVSLTDTLASTFILMLRLASPFIIYGLLFNLSIGMVNKLAPQIPIYFISIPFILTGGLILLYLGISDFLILFMDGFFRIFEGQ
jgi:flagellar biosynthetic protein FliR